MILPGSKRMLPVGSYIRIARVWVNSSETPLLQPFYRIPGFVRDDDNPSNPMRFDAISLAPNFDIPTGRCRMTALTGMITDWELYECPQEEQLVCIPPEDLIPCRFV